MILVLRATVPIGLQVDCSPNNAHEQLYKSKTKLMAYNITKTNHDINVYLSNFDFFFFIKNKAKNNMIKNRDIGKYLEK